MIEILVVVLVTLPAIGFRAQQRGVSKVVYVSIAAVGYGVFLILLGAGLTGLLLRWGWLGTVWLFLEFFANRGRKTGGTWQCPNCLVFQDARTLVCGCGYAHPDSGRIDSPSADQDT